MNAKIWPVQFYYHNGYGLKTIKKWTEIIIILYRITPNVTIRFYSEPLERKRCPFKLKTAYVAIVSTYYYVVLPHLHRRINRTKNVSWAECTNVMQFVQIFQTDWKTLHSLWWINNYYYVLSIHLYFPKWYNHINYITLFHYTRCFTPTADRVV